jgi:4-hydroxy-3-methylbut-2-enyl diphosphate reductase
VVDGLAAKGAVFVEELDVVPKDTPVVFSAHGVPKSVSADAERRNMFYIDATCPLVTKVHVDAARHAAAGRQIVLIGHAGHPEVVGTLGQLPDGAITLVENETDVDALVVEKPDNLAYVTQTTLSVDETKSIVAALKRRFPAIANPRREDICYATSNRQAAVKAITSLCDALIVIGAPNSSNSNRLAEVARAVGCTKTTMIERAADLDMSWLDGVATLGITAGASAPELLVQELIDCCRQLFDVTIEEVDVTREDITFSLPRSLNT